MAGIRKPKPIEVFEDNIAGAERLIALTHALRNGRSRRMRRELREAVGPVVGLAKRNWDELDCVESDDLFIVLKPAGRFARPDFTEVELRPLLRQAVVAIAAAVESYVAEKACSYIGGALDDPPQRLRELSTSLGDIMDIEERYKRRRWGYRDLAEAYVIKEASASPVKIGIVFATVGKRNFWRDVDKRRGVAEGASEAELEELCKRRNRIAHTGDRVGRKRATLGTDEVENHYANAKSIVEAMEAVL